MSDIIKISDIPRKYYSISRWQLQYWIDKNQRNFNQLIFDINGIKHCRIADLEDWYSNNRLSKQQKKYDNKRTLMPIADLACSIVDRDDEQVEDSYLSQLILKIINGELLKVNDGW